MITCALFRLNCHCERSVAISLGQRHGYEDEIATSLRSSRWQTRAREKTLRQHWGGCYYGHIPSLRAGCPWSPALRFPPLVEGRFIKRLNRFAALVDVEKREYLAHVPNSGRMGELLVPGYRVLLNPAPAGSARKTAYDLALVDTGHVLSSADARLPNKLVAEAIAEEQLPQFTGYPTVYPERTFGESRLDFLLEGTAGSCYVETKSVTLVEDGVGLFPDAPTLRGVKHLHSLMAAMDEGHRAGVIFVIQRADAEAFAPHDDADPLLGETLRAAVARGVEVWAYRCRVDEQSITLADEIPALL